MTRFLLIVNPNAGGSRGREAAEAARVGLEEAGVQAELRETERAGHAPEIVREALGAFDGILGIGGDGTLNEIVRGLDHADAGATPVGIIPLGTANVLAMELGLSTHDPRIAARDLGRGRARPMPFSLATCGEGDATSTLPVLVNVGVGFDARVVHRVAAARRKRAAAGNKKFSKNSYLPQGLRELYDWQVPEFEVTLDGEPLAQAAGSITACNTKNYGGVMTLTPAADMFAEGMDVCVRFGGSRLDVFRHLRCAKKGREDRPLRALYRRVREFEVRSKTPEAVQVDGDDVGMTPLVVRPAPTPLQLLVPSRLEAPSGGPENRPFEREI